jgi:ankyrin repeat protein
VRELTALVDSGWDPASSTDGGTTALMMAAPDADKVTLLLARGVDVTARGRSKADALTIAAAYGGTSASVQALLAAGAEAEAPEGVRVRRAPIVLASMAGEDGTVRLLLAHGATPSSEALSEAVTFDRVDVARLLIEAGADARITESSGVNLLHWAAITNRAALIPVLASAGVPIDQADEAGFTPLMYAATIDHGETNALRALLAAGADARVRNRAGRTPLAQARQLGHRAHAAVLAAAAVAKASH